jgi:hypothetical protein
MNYYDLFITNKKQIEYIVERSHYRNQIHSIFIVVINKKIKYEKKYINEFKKHLCQHQTLQTTSENEPEPEPESEPEPEQLVKHARRSFTNSIYDSSSKYRINIRHKISPDIEDIPSSSSGDHTSPSELPDKLVIGGQHVFNDDEYESVETYLYGLNEIHIRMIAKYYNIFYVNSFITYLLDTKNTVNNAKNILLKWLYGNIDEYIYKHPTQINNKQQHQYQKTIKNSHVKSAFQPTNRILTTENPTMVVAVTRQPNKLRSINESVPSDKITLSKRIYRIFSNMWRCFSIIMYFCWLITIRIFSG